MGVFKNRSDYFKMLCQQHVLLLEQAGRKCFMRLNALDEADASVWNNAHSAIVIHEQVSGRFVPNGNNAVNRFSHVLYFLVKSGPLATDMELAKDKAFTICKDFAGRFMNDVESGMCSVFSDVADISFEETGPYSTSYYGWKLTFTEEPAGDDRYTRYDADAWS